MTAIVTEHDGKTTLSFRQEVFPSVADRDSHHSGWSECFDRLAAYVAPRGARP